MFTSLFLLVLTIWNFYCDLFRLPLLDRLVLLDHPLSVVMGVRHVAKKVVQALSISDFALYELHSDSWRLCTEMHTRIRQIGDKWGVEFIEGPCAESNSYIDLVQPLGSQMIDCFEEE